MPDAPPEPLPLTRREMLHRCGMGFAQVGLATVLASDGMLLAAPPPEESPHGPGGGPDPTRPLAPRKPHFPAKAKAVLPLFMNGGPSHVDTFDPKPELTKYDGKTLPVHLITERKTGAAFGSPFKFQKYGKSGLEASELFAHTAAWADEITVIRSMTADVPNHEPSFLLMNCGDNRLTRPAMGSWVTYGLGSGNENLPGFIALCPGGYPTVGVKNWQSAFLPGAYQATHIDTQHTDVEKLIENIRNANLSPDEQRRQLGLLRKLNDAHKAARGSDPQLEARIQAFELAFRMQTEAAEVFDVSREPKEVLDRYGPGVQARQILIARRLIEKGVRFVQVWHGAGQPWDSHDDIADHKNLAGACDRAIAALLQDLKDRGLLETTLVLWGGEFGRTPTVEMDQKDSSKPKKGRDHNHHGFSVWLAGGGVKKGCVYGATDEFGFKAVENPVHVHDLHATMLHLLGFDHERLTYRYAGRDFRLTDVHGKVIKDIIA